jgi:two-component system, NarL family, response regulator DesR
MHRPDGLRLLPLPDMRKETTPEGGPAVEAKLALADGYRATRSRTGDIPNAQSLPTQGAWHLSGRYEANTAHARESVRVLLAEDVALIRGALAALIDLEPDITVVAEVGHGDKILDIALQQRPDVAIIDIDRPGSDMLPAAAQLHEHLPSCRTLILTSLGRPGMLRGVLALAVAGFILKDAPPGQLATAIRSVASGRRMVGPELAAATWSSECVPLSRREHAVLRLAGDGAEPAEIAAELSLSVGTVRNYLTTIVTKLHARNRVDAVRMAYVAGWLP